jgi:hypothetical protein
MCKVAQTGTGGKKSMLSGMEQVIGCQERLKGSINQFLHDFAGDRGETNGSIIAWVVTVSTLVDWVDDRPFPRGWKGSRTEG